MLFVTARCAPYDSGLNFSSNNFDAFAFAFDPSDNFGSSSFDNSD